MQVLVLEQDHAFQARIAAALAEKGFHVICMETIEGAEFFIREDHADLLILGERIGGKLSHTVALLAECRNPMVSAILLTERGGQEVAELFDLIPSIYSILGRQTQPQVIAQIAIAAVEAQDAETLRNRLAGRWSVAGRGTEVGSPADLMMIALAEPGDGGARADLTPLQALTARLDRVAPSRLRPLAPRTAAGSNLALQHVEEIWTEAVAEDETAMARPAVALAPVERAALQEILEDEPEDLDEDLFFEAFVAPSLAQAEERAEIVTEAPPVEQPARTPLAATLTDFAAEPEVPAPQNVIARAAITRSAPPVSRSALVAQPTTPTLPPVEAEAAPLAPAPTAAAATSADTAPTLADSIRTRPVTDAPFWKRADLSAFASLAPRATPGAPPTTSRLMPPSVAPVAHPVSPVAPAIVAAPRAEPAAPAAVAALHAEPVTTSPNLAPTLAQALAPAEDLRAAATRGYDSLVPLSVPPIWEGEPEWVRGAAELRQAQMARTMAQSRGVPASSVEVSAPPPAQPVSGRSGLYSDRRLHLA